MKFEIPFFLVAAVMFSSVGSFAGGKEGHGGVAYVCRDEHGKITSARLLDLWEGEDLKTWKSSAPIDSQIGLALARMLEVSPNLWAMTVNHLSEIRKDIYSTDRLLSETGDALSPYQPEPGCAYEQVARYEQSMLETGKSGLKVNREIYESPAFTNSDRAGLLLHEAIYLQDRIANDVEDSHRTRIVVAHLLSESKLPNAVRLTLAAIGGITIAVLPTPSDRLEVQTSLLALRDPSRLHLRVHFTMINSIDFPDINRVKADAGAVYQCVVRDSAGADLGKTGWLRISDLIGMKSTRTSEDSAPANLSVAIPIPSFEPDRRDDVLQAGGLPNTPTIACTRRSIDGIESSVPFRAVAATDGDAECLFVPLNSAVRLASGDDCDIAISSLPNLASFTGVAYIEVVQAL